MNNKGHTSAGISSISWTFIWPSNIPNSPKVIPRFHKVPAAKCKNLPRTSAWASLAMIHRLTAKIEFPPQPYTKAFAWAILTLPYVKNSKLDKKNGSVSLNIYHQLLNSIKLKKLFVDFVGINSPNRGYFKTSFGGETKIYFELKIKN